MADKPMGRWKVLYSSLEIDSEWFRVRRDHCTASDEVGEWPYYVVEAADLVHIVALDVKDNVVMVSQYRHGSCNFSLELPGGCVDLNENITEAIRRELLEETGYIVNNIEHVVTYFTNPARYNNRVHFFVGYSAFQERSPIRDRTEETQALLLPLSRALELALNGGIAHPGHAGGLLTIAARKRANVLQSVLSSLTDVSEIEAN